MKLQVITVAASLWVILFYTPDKGWGAITDEGLESVVWLGEA